MNRTKIISAVLMVVILMVSQTGRGDSIWVKRDKNLRSLYADDVARKIGDVLTVIVTEDSKVDNKAKRDLKKDVDKSITFDGKLGNFSDLGEFGTSIKSGNELKSKADYKDERKFTDRITVVVVDVQPNGNLVVLGSRHRDIGGDSQSIEVSGIVRPSDIAFDNTVKSEQVADFRIVSSNGGISEPYKKPGFLGRTLDIIWPF